MNNDANPNYLKFYILGSQTKVKYRRLKEMIKGNKNCYSKTTAKKPHGVPDFHFLLCFSI